MDRGALAVIYEREYGFLLPDRSRIVGPVGGRHAMLAFEYFPTEVRHSCGEENLESFLLAIDAGWVSFAVTPKTLVLYMVDEPGPRERAAELVHEHRGVEVIFVSVHPVGEVSRTGKRRAVDFGFDDRAAIRWLRSSTLPIWATDIRVLEHEVW